MNTHPDDSTRPASSNEHGVPRPRPPGPPWSLVHRREWYAPIASHVAVAVLTTLLLVLVRYVWPRPPHADEPPLTVPPSRITVTVRGGSASPDGPAIRSFAPEDRLELVVRHDGQRGDQTKLLVRARQLSSAHGSTTGRGRPELFVTLDPRRSEWHERSLVYRGRVDEVLPLAPGLWRLTFMLCDRAECEPGPLHVCAQVDAWLRVQT